MTPEREKFVVRCLIAAEILSLSIMVALVYPIALTQGYAEYPKYYPSAVIAEDPTRAIGAVCLSLFSVFTGAVLGLRLARLLPLVRLNAIARRLWWSNVIATFVIVFATIGIGAVTIQTSELIHWIFAFLAFFVTPLLLLFMSVIDFLVKLECPAAVRNTRVIILIAIICAAVSLVITSNELAVFSPIEICLVSLIPLFISTYGHRSEFPLSSRLNAVVPEEFHSAEQSFEPARDGPAAQ